MNKAQLLQWWEHFRTVNGITMRAIQAIPADKIDAKPCSDMRTPKELITHMYNTMRIVADGIGKGEFQMTEEDDAKAAAGFHSLDEIKRFALDSWKSADKAIQSLPDEKVMGMVKTPWGHTFPGFVLVQIIYDEHLHHRGQLFAFLRQMGVEPPFLWDFENNAPEFRPAVPASQA